MTEYKDQDVGFEWQEGDAERFEKSGYVALKLTIKNPGTPGEDRCQIGAWVAIDDTIDLDKPIGEDLLLKEVLTMLLERTMRARPPSKQG